MEPVEDVVKGLIGGNFKVLEYVEERVAPEKTAELVGSLCDVLNNFHNLDEYLRCKIEHRVGQTSKEYR
jgi:hypothetical protein